jgi:hypothetical protein
LRGRHRFYYFPSDVLSKQHDDAREMAQNRWSLLSIRRSSS